jgi:hypothetical protein
MNETQYKVVKFFLEQFKMEPKQLVKAWKKYGVILEIHEVYRVKLTINYEVYKQDQTPSEDVMLVMEGLVK